MLLGVWGYDVRRLESCEGFGVVCTSFHEHSVALDALRGQACAANDFSVCDMCARSGSTCMSHAPPVAAAAACRPTATPRQRIFAHECCSRLTWPMPPCTCTNCHEKHSGEGRDGHGVPVQRAAAVNDAEGSQQQSAGDLLLVSGVDGTVGGGGVTQVQRVAHGGVVKGEACSSVTQRGTVQV